MKLFIDTANVEDIRKANDMGVICGVTTNPSLIAKEGRDFKEAERRGQDLCADDGLAFAFVQSYSFEGEPAARRAVGYHVLHIHDKPDSRYYVRDVRH